MGAPLVIAGRTLRSRLLLGTGGFTRMAALADAIEASQTELVTVAMRRVEPGTDGSVLDVVAAAGVDVLPNTAGCFTARDAVLCASAISRATDPVAMAHAIRHAVLAGELARGAGRIERRTHARASSPAQGIAEFVE